MSNIQFSPEVAVWFNNKTGNHNFLDNHKRPVCNLAVKTDNDNAYASLFSSKQVQVKVGKTHTTIRIPNDLKQPIFRTPMKKDNAS